MSSGVPFYFVLTGCRLLNDDGADLSRNELMKFWGLYNMMLGSSLSTFILRGESDENLRSQFGTDSQNPALLAKYLFMVGEKGRICWTEKEFLDPEDVSLENFRKICMALKRYIYEGLRGNSYRSAKMRDFFNRNERFCRAIENTDSVVDKYSKLPTKARRAVNQYYLSIAHTINSFGYRKASSFVSATTSADVANEFTDDICIYGWVPKNYGSVSKMHHTTIEYVIAKSEGLVKGFGMPYCETPVYPDQKEVILRCGFLPHFMIGFKLKNRFYVNPAVFLSMGKMEEMGNFKQLCQYKSRLLRDGLEVNQANFEAYCRLTNFRRYYTFDGARYEIHCLY